MVRRWLLVGSFPIHLLPPPCRSTWRALRSCARVLPATARRRARTPPPTTSWPAASARASGSASGATASPPGEPTVYSRATHPALASYRSSCSQLSTQRGLRDGSMLQHLRALWVRWGVSAQDGLYAPHAASIGSAAPPRSPSGSAATRRAARAAVRWWRPWCPASASRARATHPPPCPAASVRRQTTRRPPHRAKPKSIRCEPAWP